MTETREPIQPEPGAMLLSAAAVTQIRDALITALHSTGGDLEDEDAPGISERTRTVEAKLRAAIRLIDQAVPA